MIGCAEFLNNLQKHEFDFFAGVPDSRLKHFCACLEETGHGLTCANEGNAVAAAAGHYLATGKAGVCYFQNSGLGNAYNPLVSLAHADVYAIPMLLIIGWRGEPDTADEPQHIVQGRITLPTLDLLGIEYAVLPDNAADAERVITEASGHLKRVGSPYALVVKGDTLEPYPRPSAPPMGDKLTRESALEELLTVLPEATRLVATTGKLSRELYELRVQRGEDHSRDLLTVGSMGHASSIALGVAIGQPGRQVLCLDGDGAALMHLGAMATIGRCGPGNFGHVLFNNGVHESVGGQVTCGPDIDFCAVAKASGYRSTATATSLDEIATWIKQLEAGPGPALLEIKIVPGSRANLGRPTTTPKDNKSEFMGNMS